MLRRPRSYPCLLSAFAAIFAFLAAPAVAADGVTITKGSSNDLVVTVETAGANIHFTYTPAGCGSAIPCYEITAGAGMVGVPVSAGGGCTEQPDQQSPSIIQCPAAGVSAITFLFKSAGTWAAYEGGGGKHARGPCSPAPVTVQTGPVGPAISVESWNGCVETVICSTAAGVITTVEADAADTVRGPCLSVIRH